MADYIERDKVLEKSQLACKIALIDADPEQCDVAFSDDFAVAVDDIVEIPAADVAPVVHGRWVGLEYDGYADGCPVYDLWECSECGEEVRGEDIPTTHPWCHGCGARMDGE